jgi:hypothetical protein
MWLSDYQYYAALETAAGEHITDVPLSVDWIPALRWTEFDQGVNRGQAHPGSSFPTLIEPLWSAVAQEPYLRGVRVRTAHADAEAVDFPLGYFDDAVTSAATELIVAGTLVPGQEFEYRVFALPDQRKRSLAAQAHTVVALDDSPAVGYQELSSLLEHADTRHSVTGLSDGASVEGSMPIFIPEILLEEVGELGREAGDIETGGIHTRSFAGTVPLRDGRVVLFRRRHSVPPTGVFIGRYSSNPGILPCC